MEDFLDQADVQMQQEGAVEQQKPPPPALGVAVELQAADGKVRLAPQLDGHPDERGQRVAVAIENEPVGGGDAVARARVVKAQDKRVVEHSRSLEDGAAAGTAAQDGDIEALAEREVHLDGGFIGVTQDDEISREGPESQEFIAAAGFAEVQQGLVASEVFLGGPQGEIAKFHVL